MGDHAASPGAAVLSWKRTQLANARRDLRLSEALTEARRRDVEALEAEVTGLERPDFDLHAFSL